MLRCRRTLLFFALLLCYLPTTSTSQESETARAPADSVYRVTGDGAKLRESDGDQVIVFDNGVRLTHGGFVVTSDRGRHFSKREITLLTGNVNIDQDSLHMESEEGEYRRFEDKVILRQNVRILNRGWDIRCDEATYFRRTQKAWLVGNVVVRDSVSTLTADSLFYDKSRSFAEAFGHMTIVSDEQSIRLEGDHGFFLRDEGEAIVDQSPHLIIDPEAPEPTVVDSDTMRFFPDEERAISYGRVKIVKGNTITQCDSAVLVDGEQRIELYGTPLAKKDNASMKSSKMFLHYDDDEINGIELVGDASLREEETDTLVVGRDSWIQGDSMMLYLHDNVLDSIRVRGNSSSEYFTNTGRRVEANWVRGDSMFFMFRDDSLLSMNVVGDAEGIYRYINLKPNETVDSLRVVADTSLVYSAFDKTAEKISYAADSIAYNARERNLELDSKARMDYQNRTLLGEHILYDADLQMLDATGTPVLVEGADKFYGDQMDYDLESGVGLIRDGSTQFMEGYYRGEQVVKVGNDVLKVWNSTYTTCDRKVPHYHFSSRRMKVYLNDKVVTGPIVLYIGETPIVGLPFFTQNIRRGRRSGILRPDFEFGITSRGDRFIRNIGYYWATNDFTDFTFIGDFNEDRSLRFRINNRYKRRYVFDGSVDLSLFRDLASFRDEWTLNARHHHTLGDKFTLNGDLRLVSSDRAPRAVSNIDNVADVIDRRIESRVSVRKTWKTMGFSASGRRTQNLDINQPNAVKVSTTLPSVTFSIPSRNLYFGRKTTKGDKGFLESLLGGIRYSPGLSFKRDTQEKFLIAQNPGGDAAEFSETITNNSSLSFSSPRRIGFLNISPSLSTSNVYARTERDIDPHLLIDAAGDTTVAAGTHTVDKDNQFSWSTGARASTNLFGTFYPNIGALTGVRHSLSPSVAYTFRPAINGRPSSQNFTVGIDNAIDVKVRKGEGENAEERKLSGIVLWALSSSYNPDAPDRQRWRDISSRVNTRILGSSVSLTQSVDPYLFQVKRTSVTSSLGFRGTHGLGTAGEAAGVELNRVAAADTSKTATARVDDNLGAGTDAGEKKGLPWSVTASFSLSKNRGDAPRSTLNANGNISLTSNWRLTYSTTYDVEQREFRGQNYTITRDLHAWNMSFARQQLGDEWEFYFRIGLNAHPEVFAEQGERGLQGGGFTSRFRR